MGKWKPAWWFQSLLPLFLAISTVSAQETDETRAGKPNIVIILIDDAALMDLGVYGGEARTQNIDSLAARGVMFTQFRASPMCAPSRAMLLTGLDNHQAGVATISKVLPDEQRGKSGYSLSFEPGVNTIARHLTPAGYRSYVTGKWDLGSVKGALPDNHGFDRSFVMDGSGADNWEDKSYLPYYPEAPWFEDGQEADLPGDFYSSKFIVDKMIEYIDTEKSTTREGRPFFAYLSFQAIHIPVQAPAEFTAHYDGVYDDGWHELRKRRWERAKEIGLVPPEAPLLPIPDYLRRWDDLSASDQALYAARMQVNAGMLEAMDFHIGRFLSYLKEHGDFENTIFVVTSDNGPEPSSADDPRTKLLLKLNGYDTGLEGIGEKGSWGFIGPEWANAAASPSAMFKFYGAEGAVRTPFILAGPGVPSGAHNNQPVHVSDITPTLLELVKVEPLTSGNQFYGRSILPTVLNPSIRTYGDEEPRGIEVSGSSALYRGNFKITRNMPPYGDGNWGLFDIQADPGETKNLIADRRSLFADLYKDYELYASEVGILDMPPNFDYTVQVTKATQEAVLSRHQGAVRAVGLVLLGLVAFVVWSLWRMLFDRKLRSSK